jgi:hydrogenase maturation protease
MSASVVIGIGNEFRCDDGVGPAVADEIAKLDLGVRVVTDTGDPAAILDAWTGAELAIAVDAAMDDSPAPGRIRRWIPGDQTGLGVVSSHAIGLTDVFALGEALGRLPDRLVVFAVDIAKADHGVGLTPQVAAAVPRVVEAVLAELRSDDPT